MNPKKILIIRNDHIGDLVLSTPVFREIKKIFPNSKITLIASKSNKSIIQKNKNIDKILELDKGNYNFKTILNYWNISKKIKKEKFDIGIDLRGSLMNAILLLWLPKIKIRIGLADSNNNPMISKITSLFFTKPVKLNFFVSKEHITKGNLKIINSGLNINSKNNWPEIISDEEDEEYIEEFLKKNKIQKYICLCPIAGLEKKQWGLNNWKRLIKKLDEERIQIILLGTKQDKKVLQELCTGIKKCKIIIDFDLRKMSLLFKKSSLVIAQDGGPMHIAWTVKANLIELLKKYQDRLDQCVPLENAVVFCVKKNSMDSIKVEEVMKESQKILKDKKAYTPCKEINYDVAKR